jgi:hypothetical protein
MTQIKATDKIRGFDPFIRGSYFIDRHEHNPCWSSCAKLVATEKRGIVMFEIA